MKIFVATAVLAAVLLAHTDAALVKRNIFTNAKDILQNFEEELVAKTYPKLVSLGQAGVNAVRYLALSSNEDSLGPLKKDYKLAKNMVGEVVDGELFDEIVDQLIPLIDDENTVSGCVEVCGQTAKFTDDKTVEGLAMFTCPALCHAALTKLRHAAETLEDKL
ncbi:hypothetical protein EGW08_011943 [Elysia chlorotica]|uniref:Uncharacterized protein n=1 Tax=Elysia chlorotica TaxID=188477 RepID=A0A3S1C1E5_ELYCH|nr:hypothetical protein EGW08_011943 [Elysia chlorotica]